MVMTEGQVVSLREVAESTLSPQSILFKLIMEVLKERDQPSGAVAGIGPEAWEKAKRRFGVLWEENKKLLAEKAQLWAEKAGLARDNDRLRHDRTVRETEITRIQKEWQADRQINTGIARKQGEIDKLKADVGFYQQDQVEREKELDRLRMELRTERESDKQALIDRLNKEVAQKAAENDYAVRKANVLETLLSDVQRVMRDLDQRMEEEMS